MQRRTIPSGQVDLATWEVGDAAGPTVVAVHGFPDTHTLWDGVVRQLADRFRVVSYDVRGAGESTAPGQREGYAVDRLVDDLVAVLDATVGTGGQAHLLGHDWGSVQLWEAVLREREDSRLTGRLASFTSISGPSLGQFAAFLRSGRRPSRVLAVANQMLRSSYVGLFHLPVLPAVVMGAVAGRTGSNGINLYRANLARIGSPRLSPTSVPVQVVVATRDAFLRPEIFADAAQWVERLERVEIDAGHWTPRTHPGRIAALVAEFVAQTDR
ncbi:MAG: alpha/beta fold hydrolase [Nocardioidaceae bacterium]